MAFTECLQNETPCPACGDGSGVPVSVLSALGEIRITLKCDSCEHDWIVARARYSVGSSSFGAASPKKYDNPVLKLIPKRDRRATRRS